MPKLFVESHEFTEWIVTHLDDDALAALQQLLAENPESGAVMPGCGGLRKLRIADPSRQTGKRGGARIIYLHVPKADWVYLMDVYGKGEKADLSSAEKKMLRRLAEEFKAEAIQSGARANRRKKQ